MMGRLLTCSVMPAEAGIQWMATPDRLWIPASAGMTKGGMERSFSAEVGKLKLGAGEVFHGEGILAVTKALLQSGVAYVGGYQGAPVSHLLDVMVQARE